MRTDEMLRAVANTGEIVTVVYNSGSRPGEARKVVIVSLSTDEAAIVEQGSTIRKHYKLAKVFSVERTDGTKTTNLAAEPVPVAPAFDTIANYATYFESELKAAGWEIIVEQTYLALAVVTFFKNGKPRKPTVMVSVEYAEPTGDSLVDVFSDAESLEIQRMPITGRERPWHVWSARFSAGRYFKDIRSAFLLFITEAREISPNRPR